MTGTGITTNGSNLPTSGTTTGMTIDLSDTSPLEADIFINGIESVDITDIDFTAASVESERTLWSTVLDGDVTVVDAPDDDFSVDFNTDLTQADSGVYVGEDAIVRGQFYSTTRIGGVQTLSGTAQFNAGDVDFEGFIYWYDPVQNITGDARVFGGDDIIVWTEETRNYSQSYVYAYADATTVAGNTVVVGSNDVVDAREAGDGFAAYLVGDAYYTSSATSFVVGGDDILYGTNASDGAAQNQLYGDVYTNFNATLIAGDDTIYGRAGDDLVYGDTRSISTDYIGGNDLIYGGSNGTDQLYGGRGNDRIYGGDGIVQMYGDQDKDKLYAGDGDAISSFERVTGTVYDDKIYGSDGGNVLKGGTGEDGIWGRDGNDKLYGGSNADRFDGGEGDDKLYGGSGADTFHIDKGDDFDTIKDFQNNADRIEIDGFSAGFDAFDFATQVGDDVVFDFGGGDGLIVEDALIGQLGNDLFAV